MIKRLIIFVTLLLCAIPSHAQSFVQVQSADGTNPTATFTNNTAAGNTIIATPGCDTNLYTCPSTTLPTDLSNPGVLFSLVTTCTATNNGTASRTNIYVAYNIPGGTRDSISYQGGNVQMVIMELSGATAVDQAVCTTGHLNTGGTATSGPITTTHPAEVVLGAGTANCSPSCTSTDFTAIGTPNWTLGTIGTQVAEYQSLTSISSSLSATATVSGGSGGTPNESYAMAEVSFWNAPRVQGTACVTGGSVGYTTCSLSGVTAGDTLLWFANANNNGGFSITNTCGGINTTLDSNYIAGGSSVAQGYITGGSGSCTVTFTSTGGYTVAAVLEEITSGYTIDKHSLLAYQSGNTITTTSVTTTTADYCFTGYADQGGNGQPSSLTALSPFVQHDFTLTFPTWGANATQTSAGAVTATWTSSGSGGTPRPAAGMMCFSKSSSPTITLTLNPQTVASGYSSVGTVVLGVPAPAGGALVTLSSSDTTVATVPLSVLVQAGLASATFTVNTGSVSSSRLVNISATYNSVTNVAILGVVPVNASPQYSIWSSSAAPVVSDDGGTAAVEVGVKFTTDTSGFVSGIRFYKSAANTGSHVGNLWTSTGQLLATATFTAETISGWQTVNFSSPILLTPNTIYVASYHTNTGHTGHDPSYFTSIGVDNPPLHASASGVSGGNGVFAIGAGGIFPNTTSLDSNYWTDVVFISNSVPARLQSLALNPTAVKGGVTSTGTVTLNIPALNGGAVVTLSSANPSVATVQSSVTVSQGSTSANFFVNTNPVAVSTPVSISASLGGTQSAILTVNPPAITSITLNPTSVMGGAANSTGKVTLDGAAPAGGATVNLSSNNTMAVTVPTTVTVAAGSTTATFTVTTFEVAKSITVSISAQLGGTATAVLSVAPCQAGHQCTPPPGCVVNAKGVFLNSAFGLQTANFTAQYDATPSQNNLDNVVGLSNGPASRYEDLAIITRFNSSGFIDARNGANYAATSSVRYSGGQTYHFRVVVNFATHTYDAYVHLSGATPEVQIASNFAFRSEVGTTSQLSNWSTTAEIGDQMVCNFVIGPAAPPPPCIQSSHSAWQGTGFAAQTGQFVATYDVTPAGKLIDSVVGLSNNAASAYEQLAVVTRFYTTGLIDARNGGTYSAVAHVPYSAGVTYHFRVVANVATRHYDAYVTPMGGVEVQIAANYSFRSEQAGVSTLNFWNTFSETGQQTVCNFTQH